MDEEHVNNSLEKPCYPDAEVAPKTNFRVFQLEYMGCTDLIHYAEINGYNEGARTEVVCCITFSLELDIQERKRAL